MLGHGTPKQDIVRFLSRDDLNGYSIANPQAFLQPLNMIVTSSHWSWHESAQGNRHQTVVFSRD